MATTTVLDQRVSLQLPAGWALTPLDGQPAGQTYLSYDLPDQRGVFALLLEQV